MSLGKIVFLAVNLRNPEIRTVVLGVFGDQLRVNLQRLIQLFGEQEVLRQGFFQLYIARLLIGRPAQCFGGERIILHLLVGAGQLRQAARIGVFLRCFAKQLGGLFGVAQIGVDHGQAGHGLVARGVEFERLFIVL